ncbi:porin [Algirhabdus cladophorae]|uniref:porin n=1 Tax=Algirhabdus cladophorae TaxID=3377108 RepID=UPI003B849FBC
MKKILLTTTALVGFAGAAAADVSVAGYAEMGIIGGDGIETQFHQDIEVTFNMSGETDGGLSFGASVQLDEGGTTGAGTVTTDDQGYAVNISGGFGTLTLGDTDGAMDWALTEAGNMANAGSLGDNETGHAGYNGSYLDGSYDGQIVRYDNTFGDFAVAISVEADDTEDAAGDVEDMGYALGLKYNIAAGAADIALGLGYQSAANASRTVTVNDVDTVIPLGEDVTALGVSAVATFTSGLTAGIVYTNFDGEDDSVSHIGVGVGYSSGDFAVHANYGMWDYDEIVDGASASGFGLAASYDLGGGASLHAGYGTSDVDNGTSDVDNGTDDDTSSNFSLGLALSF